MKYLLPLLFLVACSPKMDLSKPRSVPAENGTLLYSELPVSVRISDSSPQAKLSIYGDSVPYVQRVVHAWNPINAASTPYPHVKGVAEPYIINTDGGISLAEPNPKGRLTITLNGKKYALVGDVSLEPLDSVPPIVVVPPDTVKPTGKGKLGINTHPWIQPALLGEVNLHRYYLSSYYAWAGFGGKIKPQPMKQAGTQTAWGLDDILINEKALGNEVLFTIHQTPDFVYPSGRGDGGGDSPPIKPGASRTDTNSYREYALFLKQIVMRYGSVKYPNKLLNVDTTARWTGDKNELKSGLNLLKYIQYWNEEKIWKTGTPEYIAPEEMAAMMSICYDMIKATDPNMIVVSPCISNAYIPYFEAMNTWFVKNRKKKDWPCDIISCNYYLNKGNADGQFLGQWVIGGGCTPSQDKGFFRVKQLVDFAAKKGKKVWITETGLDDATADQSQMSFTGTETERGNALVETANAMFASGVDAVFLFTAADEYNAGKTLYQRSGLLKGQEMGYAKKQAFDIVNTYAKSLSLKAMQSPQSVDRSKRFKVPSEFMFYRPMKKN